jgi:hypothetical protein
VLVCCGVWCVVCCVLCVVCCVLCVVCCVLCTHTRAHTHRLRSDASAMCCPLRCSLEGLYGFLSLVGVVLLVCFSVGVDPESVCQFALAWWLFLLPCLIFNRDVVTLDFPYAPDCDHNLFVVYVSVIMWLPLIGLTLLGNVAPPWLVVPAAMAVFVALSVGRWGLAVADNFEHKMAVISALCVGTFASYSLVWLILGSSAVVAKGEANATVTMVTAQSSAEVAYQMLLAVDMSAMIQLALTTPTLPPLPSDHVSRKDEAHALYAAVRDPGGATVFVGLGPSGCGARARTTRHNATQRNALANANASSKISTTHPNNTPKQYTPTPMQQGRPQW